MLDMEKVIKGLGCCAHEEIGDCENCPYNENTPHCDIAMMRDAIALLKAQEPIETRLHLCESCTKEYPECDATADGIEFGCGVGNDNVIGCTAYVNRWKAQEPVKPLKMEVEHVRKKPVVFSYQCPVCMCGLQQHWVACPICGTGVKWND